MKQLQTKHWTILLIIATIAVAYFSLETIYNNKAYPGLSIGHVKVGGKTQEEIKDLLQAKISDYENNGFTFYYQGSQVIVLPKVMSFDPDLSYPVLFFNSDKTVSEAMSWGRKESLKTKISERLKALFSGNEITLAYTLNEEELIKILKQNYSYLEFPAQDASLEITIEDTKRSINIRPEELGKIIDYSQGVDKLKYNLNTLKNLSITLTDKTSYPIIYKSEAKNLEPKINSILDKTPIKLSSDNKQWQIDEKLLVNWLTLKKEAEVIKIALSEKEISKYLEEEIAPNIDKKPVKAEFTIEDNKVTKFQIAEKGLKLIIEDNVEKISQEIIDTDKNNIALAVSEIGYETSNNLDLGIKEIIGTGHSNFSGSSSSRKENIRVGAETLNGMLIKPGQEFSLIGALGDIDAAAGYLPELVIKGDKTIPEYGGGLCQIGTTVFRTALATGLPITDRRNHSYRVSYYEPAGTDATIYDPAPDLKFLNDTNDYVMIQYRIEGNDIYFDFWGTSDGRIATTTYPTIYNITPPPPTKYIETEDLEPGTVKCTERAHNGADAFFDYKVIYPETSETPAEIKEKRFYSHYVPWQEVCLIAKEEQEETASSTDIITSE